MQNPSPLATPHSLAFRMKDSSWVLEPPQQDDPRTPFDRDRDRILHSPAFRRLNHKTQVVFNPKNDHLRTRLTHSLEVSQIARSIARVFNVDESLTEAIALAHDLGHPPFGHAGEEAINDFCQSLKIQPFSFFHNDQTLRIVCSLEERHTPNQTQSGLNLSAPCLEGIAKHNGPFTSQTSEKECPEFIKWFSQYSPPFNLKKQSGLEAQIAAISDDIAYLSHDLDDALRFNAIQENQLQNLKIILDIQEQSILLSSIKSPENRRSFLVRHIIDFMVKDIIKTLKNNLETHKISSYHDVIQCPSALVAFSETLEKDAKQLKDFLSNHFYRGGSIKEQRETFKNIISKLLNALLDDPSKIIDNTENPEYPPRVIVDYVAGMTDRFALDKYKDLFGKNDNLYQKALEYARFSL
jgi:dGTPase